MIARRSTTLIPLMLFATLATTAQAGQVYTWKDASGKIHYADRPPQEQQSDVRKVGAAPAATDDVEAAKKNSVERQITEREKQQKTQEAATKARTDQSDIKLREENCQRSKNNLTAIESGLIRFIINAQGERVALEDTVRENELTKARKNVDEWCKPPTTATK